MPRPRRCRRVGFEPDWQRFAPRRFTETVVLTLDEIEAIRLKDLQEMDQLNASEKMGVSQPTFHRILITARKKIADALVNGKALRIETNEIKNIIIGEGLGPGRGFGRGRGGFGRGLGRGRRRMGGFVKKWN